MTRKTKVMYLIKGLGLGGAEKLLEQASPHLDWERFDYEVVYLLPWKNALVPYFERTGVPVFCLNQRRTYDLRVVRELVRLLRDRRVDLLHLHLPYSGILGRLASKMAPVKAVVYTEHNLWERYHWLTMTANRLTYRWNDAVISVSDEVERSIRSHYRVNGKPRLSTILNGVDVDQLYAIARDPLGVRKEFGIPEDHQLVAHVANFTPKKRHEDLLRAVQLVCQRQPAITFLLVGQGPLEAEMKALAQDLNITGNVVFAGFRTDATRLMAAADLFVLPSQYEGLPVSLLEAMGLGLPVVATRVGGVPEVVSDGVEGFLVEPLHPGLVAEKVLELTSSPELRQRFSRNGVERVNEHFSVRAMVASTEALYTQVLTSKGVS